MQLVAGNVLGADHGHRAPRIDIGGDVDVTLVCCHSDSLGQSCDFLFVC